MREAKPSAPPRPFINDLIEMCNRDIHVAGDTIRCPACHGRTAYRNTKYTRIFLKSPCKPQASKAAGVSSLSSTITVGKLTSHVAPIIYLYIEGLYFAINVGI